MSLVMSFNNSKFKETGIKVHVEGFGIIHFRTVKGQYRISLDMEDDVEIGRRNDRTEISLAKQKPKDEEE